MQVLFQRSLGQFAPVSAFFALCDVDAPRVPSQFRNSRIVKSITYKTHKGYLSQLLKSLNTIDNPDTGANAYGIFTRVMKSKDYGVPQSRPRYDLVGIKRDQTHKTFE